MFERLAEIKKTCKDKKQINEIIKQAIEVKQKSIESKEKLLEVMDMLIINRINMVEEIQFIETRNALLESKNKEKNFEVENIKKPNTFTDASKTVTDLIDYFEKSAQIKEPRPKLQ
ncbi:hypothetical protein NEPAR06_1965 [Nematocida parisii]|uniref:Uncharacterized protein n=1 Tax=Nematocida parisii (strain ERTm3) TaxID=935791 RepID=I3EFE6_NEMP3|nr:uncharacterized protein NEPG_02118 [Nematocida parisii ERTm1]EIJ87943.1 hypothetical protein NEQG_02015 [Nematocida parisii ERTm3]KAI5130299.1 hypothetical protein NEPAR03_2051 [Nematocida parisii]EIJ93162.1 hypothetical protein NEPG_02118 [Nematocida parisii ERTm1]KAI5130490.1 hypothetical protein NEPAR08_2047 [Nematocida parisii]KAI5143911.1 hypothetical protein NEPAR04_1992 [Nematocida parisii]|eukprot:XP_013059945.1 hypothetical protein NEPG_02118 [Nematocida parisii ERTm1]